MYPACSKRHTDAVRGFMELFDKAGYDVNLKMLNANDYDVPEDRDRVFYIGFRKDLNIHNFEYPTPQKHKPTLRESIWDLQFTAIPALERTRQMERLAKYLTTSISLVHIRLYSYPEIEFVHGMNQVSRFKQAVANANCTLKHLK